MDKKKNVMLRVPDDLVLALGQFVDGEKFKSRNALIVHILTEWIWKEIDNCPAFKIKREITILQEWLDALAAGGEKRQAVFDFFRSPSTGRESKQADQK